MESIDALLQSKVKVDAATNKGSVLGLLKVLTGMNSSNCSEVFGRLKRDHPELGIKCARLKINGKGNETPVADAATLVEIVFVCPGKMAREFRRTAAETLCRLLRGDLTLVDEIQQRHSAVQGTDLDTFLAPPSEAPVDAMGHRCGEGVYLFPLVELLLRSLQPEFAHGFSCVQEVVPANNSLADLSATAAQMANIVQLRREDISLRREESALMERQLQLRREDIILRREELALMERHMTLRREELALAAQAQQQHEHDMQMRERYVPMVQHYMEMTREKAVLLKQSTELRYDHLRADYTPSTEEFTFWDACVLAATLLMADHGMYAEAFDVWSFCSECNWFCTKCGTIRLWGPETFKPQPLWYFVHKVLAITFVKRAGSGTDMVNYYSDTPGNKERMAAFIIKHIKASEGKQHQFCPPYGINA